MLSAELNTELNADRLRRAAFKERLTLFDLTVDEIDRLHGPVGLHLGGRTPAEIAVAILAEIIAVRHGVAPVQKKLGSAVAGPLASAANG